MSVEGAAVTYTTPGSDFENILKTTKFTVEFDKIKPNQVVIKAKATPINPSDLGQIIGGYNDPKKISHLGTAENQPLSVGGNEGVYQVIYVGSNVKEFSKGDQVIPWLPAFGTWRTIAIAEERDLIKVNGISVNQAATISINPSTAYQILNQFVTDWKNGEDWIIQNSGNSQVSKYVSQLATKLYGISVISIVRDGKSQDEIDGLLKLGAKHVISESEFKDEKFDIKKYTGDKANVRLALNGSTNSTVSSLVKSLSPNGTLVSYGVVGGTKIEYDERLQLFRNLATKPFWLTANTYRDPQFKKQTVEKLVHLYKEGKITDVPYNKVLYKATDGDKEDLTQVYLKSIAASRKSGKQVIFYE
ncbi:hypothetical protein KGF56_000025 [Candida oxycetoniae]|uniref:enoyl-[acyl-carrier-protein] reductase n=1 Tax=Candida oxycetoniae TaxID=497107 RepID=A0AAI9T282_9ASCO|nr:uncharacterized protein KGF56_000025 [Candida oxycetoniae]KAI3407124.2 hypothetical protein KGF56_000025 [Candida oxycetoniae]